VGRTTLMLALWKAESLGDLPGAGLIAAWTGGRGAPL